MQGAATKLVDGLPPVEKVAIQRIYTSSIKDLWIFYTAIGAVGLGMSLLITKQTLSKSHQVQKTGLAQEQKYRLEAEERRKNKRMSKSMGGTTAVPTPHGEKVTDLENGDVSGR